MKIFIVFNFYSHLDYSVISVLGHFLCILQKNKIKEGYSSAQPIELLIINGVPLTEVPPPGYQKPRRRKKDRDPLMNSRKVGSPNGWMYEQRERANVKCVGKVDQVVLFDFLSSNYLNIYRLEAYGHEGTNI